MKPTKMWIHRNHTQAAASCRLVTSLNISLSLSLFPLFSSPNTISLSLSLASGLSWFHTVWADSISHACFDWLHVLSLSILSLSLMAFLVGWRGLRRDRELWQCCHLQMQHPHLRPIAISPRADGLPVAKSTLANGKREKGMRALKGEVKWKKTKIGRALGKTPSISGVKEKWRIWTQMESFFRHVKLSLWVYQVIEALDEKALIRSVSYVHFLKICFSDAVLWSATNFSYLLKPHMIPPGPLDPVFASTSLETAIWRMLAV